jgi:tetratricopeptide (TPR) repeat protein
MELQPLNAYVCHALSNLEKRIRNFDRAREVLEVVVKERPTSALCVSLAELERQLGDSERAREVLLHGLNKCDKERSKLLLALAWLEEDAFDNAAEAKKLIDEAMVVDKNNVRVHVAKASMELRSGRINEARSTLRQATELQSDDGVHYTMWATLEIDSGNFREARRLLEEGAEKFPGDQFLLQRWGALEAKFGSVLKARELFDRSIIIQPHAPTFVAWAILEEDQGILVRSIR